MGWQRGRTAALRHWSCRERLRLHWAFSAEPALLQEQGLHPHPAPLGHILPPGMGPACRTMNPALSAALAALWVNPFVPLCCQPQSSEHSSGSPWLCLSTTPGAPCSTSRPLLWHIPLSAGCWRHRREFWHSTVMHRLCTHPAPPAPHPSTAHSAVPLSEQMTGLIPQVFVTVLDNRLNTKRAAGIIWKKRKQLPGLNGSTVMLAACRLQQRKPHSPKSSWQPLNNPIKQKK